MRRTARFVAICALAAILSAHEGLCGFSEDVANASIVPEFVALLEANPLLMSEGGAKFLRFPGGTNILFAVGVTDRRKSAKPAAEALRQRRVAEAKARKAVTESLHAIRVETFTQTTEKTIVRKSGNKEEVVEDLTEVFEKSESEVSGWIPGLPIVGTWILTEDDLFCLAIGRIFPPR